MQNDTDHHETNDPLVELRNLLATFEANELTEQQELRLQQLVAECEPARHLYLRYMFMYGKLHQKHHAGRKTTPPSKQPLPDLSNQDNAASSNCSIFPLLEIEKDLLSSETTDLFGADKTPDPSDASSGIFGNINFSFMPRLIMVVLGILILSLLIVLPGYWSKSSRELQWNVVAQVTKIVDCYWKQDSMQPTVGSVLIPGQKLELELGLTELEFVSGAKVILEGPAEFTIIDDNSSNLTLGRLAAIVPEQAEGFTVETPNLDVVDLGTEFGVTVEERGDIDVHVFKGVVEANVTKPIQLPEQDTKNLQKKKRREPGRKIRLEKNHAVQYSKTADNIVPIPVDENRFVRSLDRTRGVTANLRVTNPSFESPDIRTLPEYQSVLGSTRFRPIYGWRVSDHDLSKSRVAMYQISPYTSSNADCNVGPGATDGRQVAVLSLGVKRSSSGKPRSNWIYQSLGVITAADIDKKLKLTVDAGPRSAYGGNSQGNGTVHAGFVLDVDARKSGMAIGQSGSSHQTEEIEQLHQLEATVQITPELVGQELFILLGVSDDGSSPNTYQYHFDNVKVTEEE